MRQIGSIQQEQRAQRFADFLVAKKIRNEVEREGGDSWSVWIHDEDRVAEALLVKTCI